MANSNDTEAAEYYDKRAKEEASRTLVNFKDEDGDKEAVINGRNIYKCWHEGDFVNAYEYVK